MQIPVLILIPETWAHTYLCVGSKHQALSSIRYDKRSCRQYLLLSQHCTVPGTRYNAIHFSSFLLSLKLALEV